MSYSRLRAASLAARSFCPPLLAAGASAVEHLQLERRPHVGRRRQLLELAHRGGVAIALLLLGARGGGEHQHAGAAAERHAQDMAAHPGIVHIGSDGSTIEERIRGAGYAPVAFGEVVAWGWQGEVAPALEWWLNSPAHVGYVLSPEYTEIGVGYATGLGPWGHYWAVDFGRPATVAPPPPPPRPYTSHVPIVLGGTVAPGIDLLDYLRGDGRAYRVGNQRGTYEVFQTQTEGDRFYQVKAWDDLSVVHWEEFTVDNDHIGRDVDTSPGVGRVYRQVGVG